MNKSQDGMSDAKLMMRQVHVGPSNYEKLSTTSQDACGAPFLPFQHAADRRQVKALLEPAGAFDRAGRSSWHFNAHKPVGSRVDVLKLASARFDSAQAPWYWKPDDAAVRLPAASPRLPSTPLTARATAVTATSEAGSVPSLPALGYQSHYHPRLY